MTIDVAFPDKRVARMVDAASRANLAAVEAEIRAGADVNYIGTDGISPLIWVLAEGWRTRDLRGVEQLLRFGANPNYRDVKRGASAMAVAAGGDSPEILALLLSYKGDPNLRGPRDEPLLHIAVSEFRLKNIDLLLQHGADINIHERNGDTAANVAAVLGRFEIVASLLDRGLNYNLTGLARSVEIRHVRPGSDAQLWKERVVEKLRQRGVKVSIEPPSR